MTAPKYVVGFKFVNKQGLKAEVVGYRGRKDIDVRFEDGAVVTTTGSYIKVGLPLHPTFGKVAVGDKFPCGDGDTVEVIEYVSSSKVLIKWLSDGATKWRSISDVRKGLNRHPTKNKYISGDVVKTNNCGDVIVKEFNSATDVLVEFSDGETTTTTVSLLKSGYVRHPKLFSNRVGTEFTTNSGWLGKVINWENAHNVLVEWQDGSKSYQTWSEVNSGGIKPLFQPSVAGIGFVGEGKYVPSSYKLCEGKEHADERIYAYWRRMLTRCYNELEQQKPSCRAYIGCTVRDDWHNFQNFAEWAYAKDQAWFCEGNKIWELDKDLLVDGNRVYSADTCTFLPPDINIFLSDRDWSEKCPRGVNYIKPATSGAKEGWIARCHVDGKRLYLGYYDDPMIAFYKYKEVKEQYAKTLAERYKDSLERDAYLKLKEYAVSPYNNEA